MKKSYEFELGDHVKYVGDVFPHLKGCIGTVQSIEPASEQVSVKWIIVMIATIILCLL